MKIAIISEHASPLVVPGTHFDSQNIYVQQLAYQLASIGHDVDVYTRRDHPQQNEIIKLRDNLQVFHVPAGPAKILPREELLAHMDDFTAYMYAHCAHMDKPYQVIHANSWMSGLVAMRLKQLLNIPFVVTFHGLGKIMQAHQLNAGAFPEIRFETEEEIMKEADSIIALCPQDRFDMIEQYNADINKIIMISGGFNPQEFSPIPKPYARKKLNLKLQDKIILQLGSTANETVAKGFTQFQKENAEVTLINLNDGNRNLLKYYYSAADVYITTPCYEPFGVTCLESMACGTPVIGSDVGGIKYTVKHGITGFLIPSKDAQALKCSLNEIYKSPRRYMFMAKECVQRVYPFSWSKIAILIDNLYRSMPASTMYSEISSRRR